MKSLTVFLQWVLEESGTLCNVCTTHDLKTAMRRFEHEGESFLTISLASFGKDLEKGLDQGYVDHTMFPGFEKHRGTPRFLGGFLDRVFDRSSGRLLDAPDTEAIRCLRQITLMWAKINLPCTERRTRAAFRQYAQCELEVRNSDAVVTEEMLQTISRLSLLLFGKVWDDLSNRIDSFQITPKHGPGQTADKLLGNQKWVFKSWTRRLESVFPSSEYLIPSWRHYEYLSETHFHEPGTELPVKVITVPKTQKTPRIIAMEPVCMQYMQQGLYAAIKEDVHKDDNLWRILGWGGDPRMGTTTRDFGGDPSLAKLNHELARRGSSSGAYATLDLKEASDRVSYQHVLALVRYWPSVREAIDATRSRKADVPGFGVLRLAKFASMGSALTFPLEAMIFTILAFHGIEKELNRPLTAKDIKRLRGKVRVFGDDIIVPQRYVQSVVGTLEAFGYRVNGSKSFWTGKFRESCGKDYYDGEDVSIVKLRHMPPSDRSDLSGWADLAEFRNLMYQFGYWKTAKSIDNYFRENRIPFPDVESTSPVVGRITYLGYDVSQTRMCKYLHRPLVKGLVRTPIIPKNGIDGVPALHKVLSQVGEEPNPDPDHLRRSGRPSSVSTKMKWAPPF